MAEQVAKMAATSRLLRRQSRRSLQRILLELSGTAAFCLLVAIGLSLAFGMPFGSSLLISNCIGFSIHGFAEGLAWLFKGRVPPALVLLLSLPLGILVGYLLAEFLLTGAVGGTWALQGRSLMVGALFGLLGSTLALLGTSVLRLRDSLRDEQLERLAGEKAMVETELRLLQAQIEPHFLFNTLSTALVLLRSDVDGAARVLEQLTRLLRASLQRTRNTQTTLGDELEVVEAYLGIASVRMGPRLRWEIDVVDALRCVELPPLLLQPLVENAVEHGLDPLPQGGDIWVGAESSNGLLRVCVRDGGVGLTEQSSQSGIALENVRQRLRALYGTAASFELTELPGGGTEARLEMPWIASASEPTP